MRTVAVKLDAITGPYIASIGKAAAATEAFASKADRYIGKHQKTISGVSATAGKMGIAVAAGIGLAVAATANFDEAMSGVAATGADARGSLDALRKTALQAGQDTKFSATEAAGGIEALAKAGISAQDIMGGGLSGALNLAAAGNISVADSADAAASAMNQFGLEGRDVPHVADLLAQAAGTASGEVSDMTLALKQAGTVAAGAGLSIDDTATGLALFAKNGLIGSDAGTSFKTMLQRLQGPSEKSKALMDELGIAAYDSTGSFVGLESVAQQLHDRLEPLTQAQRDQALVTIFGSDAIRGANILYKDGAKALQDQRIEMGKYGTAAQVAATKMDNLKGDVEQLIGSVETAAISLGEGGQGPMRRLTQDLTGAVNAFNKAPQGAKSTALAVGTVTAAALLGAAAVGKLAIGVNNSRKAFTELIPPGSKARGVMVDFGKASAYATGAVVGLKVLGWLGNQLDGKFNPAVEDATGLLVDLAHNAPNAGAALDQAFHIESGKFLKDNVDGLIDSFTRLGEHRWSDQLGEAVDKIGGTADAVTTKIRLQFAAVDQSLSKLGADAPRSFQLLADAAAAAGVPMQDLVEMFPAYATSVRAAAEANGVQIKSTDQLVGLMRNGVPPAAHTASGAIKGTKGAVAGMGNASQDAEQDLKGLIEKMFGASRAAIALQGSEDGLEQAIDDATKAARTNGRTLDNHTEKGRANRAALRNLAEASINYRQKLIEQGARQEKVTRTTEHARAEFIRTAIKMGATSREARELANKFGLVDKAIDNVDGQTVVIRFKANTSWKDSSGVKWSVNLSAPSSVGRKRAGGIVEGPGTGTSDSILGVGSDGWPTTRVSRGEFVVNKKATDKHRAHLEAINRDGLRAGGYVDLDMDRHGLKPANSAPGNIARIRDKYARGFGDRIAPQMAKYIEADYPSIGGLPSGGRATGRGMGALFSYARRLGMGHGTYPGHGERGMNKSWDFTPVGGGRGNRLAGHAWANARQYGIWYVIWNRRIASRTRPGAGWRPYTRYGSRGSPSQMHTNHVHISWYGKGTKGARSGLAVVGEHGPELLNMRGGEQITPARTPEYRFAPWRGGSSGGGGGGDVTIVLNAPNYVGSRDELKRTFVTMLRRGDLDILTRR